MTRLEFCTLITGVGVTVGSSVACTYRTDMDVQQPFGTVMIAVEVTFPYSSTAAGVKIALLVRRGSPFTVSATAMGVTAPPVGIEMFPLNVT